MITNTTNYFSHLVDKMYGLVKYELISFCSNILGRRLPRSSACRSIGLNDQFAYMHGSENLEEKKPLKRSRLWREDVVEKIHGMGDQTGKHEQLMGTFGESGT